MKSRWLFFSLSEEKANKRHRIILLFSEMLSFEPTDIKQVTVSRKTVV